MPGIYRPRHPEGTVLYRVLFHNFDRFLAAYERRFEKEYGYFRPIIQEVVERYLDYANPRGDFARIRCPDCHNEHLLTFSCKTRGFCPSCHAKRLEEWGEWVRETLLLDVPHYQVVFTIPKTLWIFFKFRRQLLGELCRAAVLTLTVYFEALAGEDIVPGVIVAVQTFGDRINFHPHLHLLVTEGGIDRAGIFYRLPRLDDARLAEMFGREVHGPLIRALRQCPPGQGPQGRAEGVPPEDRRGGGLPHALPGLGRDDPQGLCALSWALPWPTRPKIRRRQLGRLDFEMSKTDRHSLHPGPSRIGFVQLDKEEPNDKVRSP